jgi:hypothetical protein
LLLSLICIGLQRGHHGLPAGPQVDPLGRRGRDDDTRPSLRLDPGDCRIEANPLRVEKKPTIHGLVPETSETDTIVMPQLEIPEARRGILDHNQPKDQQNEGGASSVPESVPPPFRQPGSRDQTLAHRQDEEWSQGSQITSELTLPGYGTEERGRDGHIARQEPLTARDLNGQAGQDHDAERWGREPAQQRP